jgi:CubicO group peptidase (beta-lactamase class C family)
MQSNSECHPLSHDHLRRRREQLRRRSVQRLVRLAVPTLLLLAVPGGAWWHPLEAQAQVRGPVESDPLLAPFDRDDGPGVLVALVEEGEITFQRSLGLADVGQGIPLDADSRVNIGSVAKQFTAFAVLLLEAEGSLSLDDDVRLYLPQLPDLGHVVTLRHLLTHTSGYREVLNALAIGGWRIEDGDHVGRDEALRVVERQPSLQNVPGDEWNYNNTGYMLLARVIEEVTGESFVQWMQAHVFAPLGMKDTRIREDRRQIIPRGTRGYQRGPGGFREAPDLGEAAGAGSVYTTLDDLVRWMQHLQAPELSWARAVAQMKTPFILNSGDTTNYGLGLQIDEHRGLRRVWHGGGDAGHQAHFTLYPDLDRGLIVLSNDGGFPSSVVHQLAERFFGQEMAPASPPVAAGSAPVPPRESDSPEPASDRFDRQNWDPAEFDRFAGRYELQPGFVLTFGREGDRLYTYGTGQAPVGLEPISSRSFALVGVDARVTFQVDAGGEVTGLTLHQAGEHFAPRIPDDQAPLEPLEAYAGRYFSQEFENYLDVTVAGPGLVVRQRRRGPVELVRAEGDRFAGSFPLLEVTFLRDEEGEVVGLAAGNVRARDIRFSRVP